METTASTATSKGFTVGTSRQKALADSLHLVERRRKRARILPKASRGHRLGKVLRRPCRTATGSAIPLV
jgi:hypothetical protein